MLVENPEAKKTSAHPTPAHNRLCLYLGSVGGGRGEGDGLYINSLHTLLQT